MNLEELVIEFSANFTSFDTALNQAIAKARSSASEIDKILGKSYGKQANLKVTAKVDDRELHDLNKHLDIKQKHFQEVQREFNRQPLTVRVDDSQVVAAISNIRRLRRELAMASGIRVGYAVSATSSASGQTDESKQQGQLIAAVKALPQQTAKAIKEQSQPSLGERVGKVVSAPFKAVGAVGGDVARGLIYGATAQVSSNFGKGVATAIEQATGVAIGSTELLGQQMGKALASKIGAVLPEELKKEIAEGLREDLGKEEVLVASRAFRTRNRTQVNKSRRLAEEQLNFERRESLRGVYEVLDQQQKIPQEIANAQAQRQQRQQALASVNERQFQFNLTEVVPEEFLAAFPEHTDLGLDELKHRYAEFLDELVADLSREIASLSEIEANAEVELQRLAKELDRRKKIAQDIKTKQASLRPEPLPKAYSDFVQDVAGGKKIARELIPQLRVNDAGLKKDNAIAQYDIEANVIEVSQELFDAIKSGQLTLDQLNTIYEEIAHAFQFDFGSVAGVEARREFKSLTPTVQPTPEELKQIGPALANYAPEKRGYELEAKVVATRKAKEAEARAAYQKAIGGLTSQLGIGGERLEGVAATQLNKGLSVLQTIQQLSNQAGVNLEAEIAELTSSIYEMSERIRQSIQLLLQVQVQPTAATNVEQLQQIIGTRFEEMEQLIGKVDALKQQAIAQINSTISSKPPLNIPVQLKKPDLMPVEALREVSELKQRAAGGEAKSPINQVNAKLGSLRAEIKQQNSQAAIASANEIVQAFRATRQTINQLLQQGDKEQARAYAEIFASNAKRAQTELTHILQQAKAQGTEVRFGDELSSTIGRAKGQISNMLKPVNRVLATTSTPVDTEELKDARKEVERLESSLEEVERLARDLLRNKLPAGTTTTLQASRSALIGRVETLLRTNSEPDDVGGEFKEARLRSPRSGIGERERRRLQEILNLLKEAEAAAQRFDNAYIRAVNQQDARSNQGVINRVAAQVDAYNQGMDRLLRGQNRALTATNASTGGFTRFGRVLDDVVTSALALVGVFTFGDLLIRVGQATFTTALEMERLKTALDFTTSGKGVETLAQLRDRADELGISFRESAKGYQQLSASLLGTNLQNQASEFSEAIDQAVSTRALSAQQSESVYRAISQILNRGKVSLEELSGQLESLPGSVNIAARAMSTTVPALIKQIETGNLTSEAFVPKFLAQLKLESQGGIASAADTAQAKINRLNNAVEKLQATFGGFTLEGTKRGIDATTEGLNFLNENAQTVGRVVEILVIALSLNLVRSLLGLAVRLGIGTALMKAFGVSGLNLVGVLLNLGTVARAVSGMLKGLIVPAAIAAGLELLFASLNRDSQKLKDVNAALETSVRNIEEAYKKAGDAAKDFNKKAAPKRTEPEAENPVLRTADTLVNKPLNRFLDFFSGGEEARKRREQATGQKDFRFSTNAEAAQADIIANRSDTLFKVDNALRETASRLDNTKLVDQTIGQLKSLDLQIQRIQTKQNVVRLEGSTEEVQKLQKELDKLQNQRTSVLEKAFGSRGDLENFKTQLEAARNEINQLISSQALTKDAAAPTLQFINQLLQETQRQLGITENITKQTAAAFENLMPKLARVNAAVENSQDQNERLLNQAKTKNLQQQANGQMGSTAVGVANLRAEQESYQRRLAAVQEFTKQYQAIIGQLTQKERESLEDYLGKSIDSALPGDIKAARELYKDAIVGNMDAALQARERLLELQKEVDTAAGQIAQSAVELRNSLREVTDQARELRLSTKDFVREYGNFVRGIINQTKELALDVQGLKNQVGAGSLKTSLIRALMTTSRGIFSSINDTLIRYLDEAQQLTQQTLDRQRQKIQQQNQIIDLQQQNQQQGRQYENLGRQVERFNQSNQGGVLFPVPGRTAQENLPGAAGMLDAPRDGGRRRHGGIDYQYKTGTSLIAPFAGTVARVDMDRGEYQVILQGIDAQGRQLQTSMAHLSEIFVQAGQRLEAGQALGKVGGERGSWGSTGAHLDLKVKVDGQTVDPRDFFAAANANSTKPVSLASTNSPFVQKVVQIAGDLGVSPLDLLSIMSFESAGTFSPSIQGPHVPNQGKGRGLIQFMPATARGLGTSDQALAGMTGVQQLDYVKKYFEQAGISPGMGLGHLYSAVFSGKASNWDRNRNISDHHHTLSGAVDRIGREHTPKAQAMLRHSSATLLGGAGVMTQGLPQLPQINLPSVDLGAGNKAIAQLQNNQAQQQQLNDVLQRQNLEQFKIRFNTDIDAAIAQRNEAYESQRKAIRELLEQQSDFKRQYQRESIASTIVQEITQIERAARGMAESYENEIKDLKKNIAGSEELIKTLPGQIEQLKASGLPQDAARVEGTQKSLDDAKKGLSQYRERLEEVTVAYSKLKEEAAEATSFKIGEILKQATQESTDALTTLQRQMRDAGNSYDDLLRQFQSPSFVLELEKTLNDVDRQFQQLGDTLTDRTLALTRQAEDLSSEIGSIKTTISKETDENVVATLNQVLQQRQTLLDNVQVAIGQTQADSERLPRERLTARLVTELRTTRQNRQERNQYLVDTEANALESRAGQLGQVDEYGAAQLEAQAARIRENLRFQVEMEGFDELASKLHLTADQAATAKQQLAEINLINLENINRQADLLGVQLREGIGSSMQSFFQDLIVGGKSLNEVLGDLIGSMAQFLVQLAAQALVKSLFGGIFGGGGGIVGTFAFGGQVQNYATGGDVMALGLSVAAAMRREGAQAVPIVAHVGEEILSTRNGDAQFYRALRRNSNLWNEMKGVNNYADGGSVGSFAPTSTVRTGGRSSDINIPLTVQYQAAAGEDEVTSRTKAEQLAKSVRAVVADELLRQTRSGGILGGNR